MRSWVVKGYKILFLDISLDADVWIVIGALC